jgi:hypothetical protein
MNTTRTLLGAAVALAAFVQPAARAQVEPDMPVCEQLNELAVAWQNLDTQDVNATLGDVQVTTAQFSAALDRVADEANQMSPAAFAALRQAHQSFEATLATVPEDDTPAELQDRIALARDNERFAYQNFASNIFCPELPRPYY